MKKYNLSNIMKRAWELVKKSAMTISSGLKKAWEEAKRTMKGTEKQIIWAKELMRKMNKEFSIVLGMVSENQKVIFSDAFEKINAIMNDSYAGDIIYHLKDNKKSGFDYYKSLYASVKINADTMAMRIKKEVYHK